LDYNLEITMTKNIHGEQPPESGTMQQVRELLFGAQIKEMEGHLERQEERFTRELDDLRAALKTRLDSFENFSRSESESILQRLQREQEERDSALKTEQRERVEAFKAEYERLEAMQNEQRAQADALERLGRELAAAQEGLERKIARLSAVLDSTEQALRQLQLAESGSLAEKIEAKYQESLRVLADTALQIRESTVPRSALAMFFNDMAFKVSGQTDALAELPASGPAGDSPNG
jgi:chromosome segregation ATPase